MTPTKWDRTIRICLPSSVVMARWAADEMERNGGDFEKRGPVNWK